MALPNGFLDELKTRLSLGQVAGRKLTWDSRKSNPVKGDYWAPCPFHQEKTASFHVDDAKGFYYCFGCHAKGDALNFVRETENVGFMEAVEILAREAGMTVPAQDPRAAEKAQKRNTLHEVMELAIKFYRLQLNSAGATAAREYIAGRGLADAHLQKFEIGFAPSGRTALLEHLQSKGIDVKQMDEAGLVIIPDQGTPFDRFRDRIMFPIRDGRGKPTAFGGRAMAAEAKAKYLNSPETPLFDKGRSLYNHQSAREAAGKAGALIVAEGYMDVIALASHGFEHAVAPLGTAITEDQLRLMWRITDEPIIALDGDKAGIRAAMRLIDVALPLLEAGKSLRFALMPDGLDPDDLLRNSGAAAMEQVLEKAQPMVSLLWQRETEAKVFDSPERRAALDASLKRVLGLIADSSIRDHYRADFRQRRMELFTPKRAAQAPSGGNWSGTNWSGGNWSKGSKRGPTIARPTQGAKASLLARGDGADAEARIRETAILRACLAHPLVAEAAESTLETLPFLNHDLGRIRDALISELANTQDKDALQEALKARVDPNQIDLIQRSGQGLAQTQVDPAEDLNAQMRRHRAIIGVTNETREAELEIGGVDDEGVTWRLLEANRAKDDAARAGFDDSDADGEEEAGKSAYLTHMVEEGWKKDKKS